MLKLVMKILSALCLIFTKVFVFLKKRVSSMCFHFWLRTGDAWPLHLIIALFVLYQQIFVRVEGTGAQISTVTENKISSVCDSPPHNSHFESSLGFASEQK